MSDVIPQLEPLDQAYTNWVNSPSRSNLAAVTRVLKPTIDSLVANAGATGNPDVASRARVIAAKAVTTYNPSMGVKLPTWVSSRMQELWREIRKSNSVLQVPDKIQLDSNIINRKTAEFLDENGREPTISELADYTGMSQKRIEKVNRKNMSVGSDSAYVSDAGDSGVVGSLTDFSVDAMDYVYEDEDRDGKRYMELALGYGGKKPAANSQEIMDKLKLTPVQLTRRKAKIALKIQDVMSTLEGLQQV